MHERSGPFVGPLPSIDIIATGRSLAQQIFGRRMPFLPGVTDYDLAYVAYTNKANTFTVAPQTIVCDADAHKGLVINSHSGTQSAATFECQKADGTALVSVFENNPGAIAAANTINTVWGGDLSFITFFPVFGFNLYWNGAAFKYMQSGRGGFLIGETASANIWRIKYAASGTAGNTATHYDSFSTDFAGNVSLFAPTDAATTTVTTGLTLCHRSTATPANGFGYGMLFTLQSSTSVDQNTAEIDVSWVSATHATRTGRLTIGAHDAATSVGLPREGFRVESSGTVPKIGFFGTAAVVQQSGDMATGLVALGLFSSATGTAYDMLSAFVSSVTNTTNADATLAYGVLSFFKATTGAHNATLPAPSAGKIIALQIDPTSTKLVTLVRSGTEKIDGVAASQIFWAGETVILRTDGTDWFTIGGKKISMLAEMYVVSTSQAALTTNTAAQLLYDTTTLDNTGLMCSTGASTITIQRSGNYELAINTSLGGAADGNTTLTVNLSIISPINNNSGTWSTNRIVQAFGTGIIGGYGSGISIGVVALTAGDVLRGWVYPIFVGVASVYYLGGNPTFTLFSAKEVL